jgi:endonuclease/exonuclease/phosphatase family metal-dependent hydrolase
MHDDKAALGRVLKTIAPDVACIQEVPRFWAWRSKRNKLAREGGLEVGSSRRVCAIAVLAKPHNQLVHREYHKLSWVPWIERRGLAIAVMDVVPADGSPRPRAARLIAASCHLDLEDEPRLKHAKEIVSLLDRVRDRFAAPVVLAGDINEEPGGPTWDLLANKFADTYAMAPSGGEYTYSSAHPVKRIDGIFADAPIEVLGCGVPKDPDGDHPPATDHRPVVAELRLAS